MKVGDILKCSWGYEQTNIDFYEVVKATKAMVTVRKIAGRSWSEEGYSAMSGFVVPCPGEFLEGWRAKEVRRKVNAPGTDYESIKIEDYSRAFLLKPNEDGTYPKSYFSTYA